MEALLSKFSNDPDARAPPNSPHHLDCFLAANYLQIRLGEFRSQRIHLSNPALYTGEAIFGIVSLFLCDFAPIEERAKSAASRLEAIPPFLEQAKANLRTAPTEWTRRAIRECVGAKHLLQGGLTMIMRSYQLTSPSMQHAADKARIAFLEFQEWLSEYLLPHSNSNHGCGKSFLDLLIQKGHCQDLAAEQVAAFGARILAERQERLHQEAFNFREDGDWQKVLESLGDFHPLQPNYLSSFQRYWQECVDTATENGFLTWPNCQIHYRFLPDYFVDAEPYLYWFLPYRSPPAFEQFTSYDYFVPPIDATMPQPEREKLLRAMNFSVIKLNHALHHGSIGHHLQNYYAYRAPSRIGQVAAVDCASRLAMLCAGTMAEGWACYCGELMTETSFCTPLDKYSELHSSVRFAARAVVDSSLHTGTMTIEDAIRFYMTEAGMSADAAHTEAVNNSMFPGTACEYLLGTNVIHALRNRLAKQEGNFNLRDFHGHFLSYGSIPVSLIAQDMLNSPLSLP